jgi:Zn finger protein HypA/HybF involved in hydrogenase expression
MQQFELRRGRQLIAIWGTVALVLLIAVPYKLPAVFGEFSKNTLFGAQIMVIAAFIAFSHFNWTCPSCHKYLGNDLYRRKCRKCGSRLRQGN